MENQVLGESTRIQVILDTPNLDEINFFSKTTFDDDELSLLQSMNESINQSIN